MQGSPSTPRKFEPRLDIPLLDTVEQCDSASKILRIIKKRRIFERLSPDSLLRIRGRLQTLEATARFPKRITSAIQQISQALDADHAARQAFIRERLSEWEEPDRPQINALIGLVSAGQTGIRPCHRCAAEADVIEALWGRPHTPLTPLEMRTGRLLPPNSPAISAYLRSSSLERPTPATMARLQRFRALALDNFEQAQAMPRHRVTTDLFPPTAAWLCGSGWRTPVFDHDIRALGEEFGIETIGFAEAKSSGHTYPKKHDLTVWRSCPWARDAQEFTPVSIRVPYTQPPDPTRVSLWSIMRDDRLERSPLWRQHHGRRTLAQIVPYSDKVWLHNETDIPIAMAEALGIPLTMTLCPFEGGNILRGQRVDKQPCALVGRDTLAAAAAILERDQVERALEIDLGCPVIPIEQPDFHLDMGLAFIAPGVVILNDSIAAWELNAPLVENPEARAELLAAAEIRAQFEQIAEDQLLATGFEVRRIPGRFFQKLKPGRPEAEIMNFFNFMTATTPGGERLVIGLGTLDATFEDRFHAIWDGIPVDHIRLLDFGESQTALKHLGGIHCRLKTIPQKPQDDQ